jgi:hypothetical protein
MRTIVVCAALILTSVGCDQKRNREDDQLAKVEQEKIDLKKQEDEKAAKDKAAYKEAIETALKTDDITSAIEYYRDRVAAMQQIDTSKCPSDYRAAYVEHIFAWKYAADVQDAVIEFKKSTDMNGVVASGVIMAVLGGDGSAPLRDVMTVAAKLEEKGGEAHKRIQDSFQKVEQIAVSYGAALPKE